MLINVIHSVFLLKSNETPTFKSLLATGPFTKNLPDLWKTVADVIRSKENQAWTPVLPEFIGHGIFHGSCGPELCPCLASVQVLPLWPYWCVWPLAGVEEEGEREGFCVNLI